MNDDITPVSDSASGLFASLGWIDLTALALLLIFLILGLFRGFVWQLFRIGTLVAAFVVAGAYGGRFGDWIERQGESWPTPDLPLYIAYFAIFVGVGVVLSVLAHFIEKFVREAGLGFFDRVGGGALGFVTGACVVLAMLLTIVMFFGKDAPVAQAAEKSQSWKYGKQVVGALGDTAPAPIRRLLGLLPDEPEGTGPRAPGVDGRLSPEPVPPRDGLGAPVDASTRREPGTTPQRPPR